MPTDLLRNVADLLPERMLVEFAELLRRLVFVLVVPRVPLVLPVEEYPEREAAEDALRALDEVDAGVGARVDDVVLDEAMNIVMDIIRLTGGEELPQPKGGWF